MSERQAIGVLILAGVLALGACLAVEALLTMVGLDEWAGAAALVTFFGVIAAVLIIDDRRASD
jgi:hypothetical protein